MKYFLIIAGATAAFAASVPANAAENWGPTRVGNQCFTPSTSQGRELYFGAWTACPQPASAQVAPTVRKKKHS
jgi:D-alanyl-D-alanine dipeptidase